MNLVGLQRFSWAALAALALSCGGDDDTPSIDSSTGNPDAPAGGPDAAGSSVMEIACGGLTPAAMISTSGFAFSPADVTISAGQVVMFSPAGPHNMTAGQPGSPTGEFAVPTGAESCLRFTEAGSFPFFCSVHPSMIGSVTVQ